MVAVTGAGGVAIAVAGGLALDAQRDFAAGLCANPCVDPDASYPAAAEQQFERTKLATNVAVGITAAAATVTVVLAVLVARDARRGGRGRGALRRAGAGRFAVAGSGLRLRF
jgi:hypothetical protein